MAGVKGRSGRRPLKQEIELHKLIELSFNTLIRAMNSPSIDENKKIDISLSIMLKYMPSRLEHNIDEDTLDFIIRLPAKKAVGDPVDYVVTDRYESPDKSVDTASGPTD